MMEIKRLDNTTVVSFDIPEGTLVHRELMGEHYVKIPFSTVSPIYFQLGDWVNISGFGRFELTELYSPKYNVETGGYDYELRLDAYYIKWKLKKCKYLPQSAASETTFNLTASIGTHLSVIVSNINALGVKDANFKYNGSSFSYALRNFTGDENAAKYKLYDDTDIISALNDLATIYDCEWWVEDNIICFGRCELNGDEVDFEMDVNVSEMSDADSKKDYATRLYAFGSERNLPKDYRADASADITQNGVVQKRLMLPLTQCPYGYVQDNGVTNETEAVEAVVIEEDIYPKVECTVSEVTTYTDTHTDEETQETVTRTYYRLKDGSGFNFDTSMILEGETLHILFQSGNMNGMDFECQFNDTEKYYEVVANEDYGRFLPDTDLHPAVGDKFVLYNWDASKIEGTGIIAAAETRLYNAALAKLAKLKIDPTTYTVKMMSDVYEEDMKVAVDTYTHYNFGQRVRLVNPAYFENGRSSRIIGYEIKLDIPYDTPQYIVGEATKYSHSEAVQQQIDAITYNGNTYHSGGSGGSGVYIITSTSPAPATDTNVYSAKRSDLQYLRKDRADTARGRITFEQQSQHNRGIQIGTSFISGLVGVGGRIDEDANGELESLRLRSWLEVPELRFNKVSIYTGIRWDTFGGGVIESITPDPTGAETGSGKLKLEDGEYGAIAVGDLCMGIWHDERPYVEDDGTMVDTDDDYTITHNANADSDDNRGNFTFAGFKTVYFQITGVSGADNSRFTYILRSSLNGGNGIHPFAGMHFAGRGNISNTARQAFTYTTTEYSLALTGVTTWEFQPSNYLEIRGHIEGFSMPALDAEGHTYTKVFHGYGQVFGNAYIFGKIDTFERQTFKMVIDQSMNGSLAPNETEVITCTIFNGYGEDVTDQFTLFSVTRNSGDAATDAVWNLAHTNVGNPFNISFNDLGIDGIHKLVSVFNVIATDEVSGETTNNQIDYFS